jgi:hypothetical protein
MVTQILRVEFYEGNNGVRLRGSREPAAKGVIVDKVGTARRNGPPIGRSTPTIVVRTRRGQLHQQSRRP